MTTGQIAWGIAIGGAIASLVAARIIVARSPTPPTREGIRRAGGNALFLMEEFINPRMEHVFTARDDQVHEDEEPGEDDDCESTSIRLKAEMASALAREPIDPADIRRLLTSAYRAGLDWRALYEHAVRAEAAARPLRALRLPPLARVAPLERDD